MDQPPAGILKEHDHTPRFQDPHGTSWHGPDWNVPLTSSMETPVFRFGGSPEPGRHFFLKNCVHPSCPPSRLGSHSGDVFDTGPSRCCRRVQWYKLHPMPHRWCLGRHRQEANRLMTSSGSASLTAPQCQQLCEKLLRPWWVSFVRRAGAKKGFCKSVRCRILTKFT